MGWNKLGFKWDRVKEDRLIELFQTHTAEQCAALLGTTISAVNMRIHVLKVVCENCKHSKFYHAGLKFCFKVTDGKRCECKELRLVRGVE